jgi:hypothetical protein
MKELWAAAEQNKKSSPGESEWAKQLQDLADSTTMGMRFNSGKLRWRNVPLYLFKPVIEVGQFGEAKYDTFNFLKGFPALDTLDALKRHLVEFEDPSVSDLDSESACNHLAHVAWNAIVLLHHLNKKELDNRYKEPKRD